MNESLAFRLAVALGIGLLIGAERERRKGSGPSRGPAGIRTFALVSLAGGLCLTFGGEVVLVAGALVVGALAAMAYVRSRAEDPGLTTEMALFITFLLGALAIREPGLAGGLAVAVAILLASRTRLHRFVSKVLTGAELHDALILAAAALVVLPLVPDRPIWPLEVLNPRTLWKLVVLVMGISAAGYVAVRALGPRLGLPLSGLASGFVSSAATVAAMGQRAAGHPGNLRAAVAGATLSTLATFVQMAVVLLTTSRATFSALSLSLLVAGGAAGAYGIVFAVLSLRAKGTGSSQPGRAFDPKAAVLFAATVTAILLLSAAVHRWLGARGLLLATALAGFADAHAGAISVASLVAAGKIGAADAVVPILAGLTTNTVTKMVAAFSTGGPRFALPVTLGLLLVLLVAWVSVSMSV